MDKLGFGMTCVLIGVVYTFCLFIIGDNLARGSLGVLILINAPCVAVVGVAVWWLSKRVK